MSSQLFRKEAIEAQQRTFWGNSLVFQPVPIRLLTFFILIITITLGSFLYFGNYARKETVKGYLQPTGGLVQVLPPRSSVISEISVQEGDYVEPGAPMLTLDGGQTTASGYDLDEAVLGAVERQRTEFLTQLNQEAQRHGQLLAGIEASISNQLSEKSDIAVQVENQVKLVDLGLRGYERAQKLFEVGSIAELEMREREREYIFASQQLASLRQRVTVIDGQLGALRQEQKEIPLESAERLSQLRARLSDLDRQYAETDARRAVTLVAPVAGTVTSLRAISGELATPNAPLLTILPANGALDVFPP